MRSVPAAIETFLENNTRTTVAHLVTLTLADSTVVRWTDHVSDLTVGGNTFTAGGTGTAPLFEVGDMMNVPGTEIGDCRLTLMCGETAQLAGVRFPLAVANSALDRARVKIERVYGVDAPDVSMGAEWAFEGVVAEATPTSTAVELSLVDGREELHVQIPRTPLATPCTNLLFDGQCSLDKATWTVTGTASSGATTLTVPTSRTEANDYFTDGVITFTSGANNGISRGVRKFDHASGTFTLDEPLSAAPANGDTFSAYPGCNKKLSDANGCAKFSNSAHFRGFYKLPRYPDAVPSEQLRNLANGPRVQWKISDERTYNILPMVYGRNRVRCTTAYLFPFGTSRAPNLLLHDIISAVCEGPISGASRMWWSSAQAFRKSWSEINNSNPYVGATLKLGTRPTQTAWARSLYGNDGSTWTNYPGVAYLGVEGLNLDWVGGDQGLELEVDGFCAGTGDATSGDACPADIIANPDVGMVTSSIGAAFSWTVVTDTGTDGTAASSARRYLQQSGIMLSPVLDSQRTTLDWLQEVFNSSNLSGRWTTNGTYLIVPLGDQSVGTYTPDVSVRYDLTEDHFIVEGDEDPISVERKAREEITNVCPISFSDRSPTVLDSSIAYRTRTIEDPDPRDTGKFGYRRAQAESLPMICREDVATAISRLRAQRSVQVRNKYTFKLGFPFRMLEPLDYVTLTDTRFGFDKRVVRIVSIRDSGEVLTVVAEDAPIGHATAALHTTQSSESVSTLLYAQPNYESLRHGMAIRNWIDRSVPALGYLCVGWSRSLGRLVALANAGHYSTSVDGINWSADATIATGGSSLRAIAWSEELGLFCAAGDSGKCFTSPDGTTWTSRSNSYISVRGIAWNGSVFCAVGTQPSTGYPLCSTSPDGITWTSQTIGDPADDWQAIVWTGGAFVAVGHNGKVATSPNGVAWTMRAFPDGSASQWYSVSAGGGIVCAVGGSDPSKPVGSVAFSLDDGATWDMGVVPAIPGSASRVLVSAIWTGYLFVAFDSTTANNAAVFSSRDGRNWEVAAQGIPNGGGFGWKGSVWAGGFAAAVSTNGKGMTSLLV